MINPDFFQKEDQQKDTHKEHSLLSLVSLFGQKLKTILSTTPLEVKVSQAKGDAILNKINGQLYAIASALKSSPSGGTAQRISLKTTDLVTLNKEIEGILRQIADKELKVVVPPVSRVTGEVRVSNPTPSPDFSRIVAKLEEVQRTIAGLKLNVSPQVNMPDIKMPEFPKTVGMAEGKAIVEAISSLKAEIGKLPKSYPQTEFPKQISVSNFPVQKYPMPVTNFNLNPLRGYVKTTAVTVTDSLTALPPEILSNRRSIMIFNNDQSSTVYIGGSTMSAGDGLPVLPQTYSPVMDAGPKMLLYGMTSSESVEVRVIELSNENIGG